MIKLLERYPIASLFLITLLMLLPNIDALTVTIMEARNFITAREMITDGNWILTTLNGNPRYEKPPLPTWLTAISGLLFGAKSLFALRLPAILMIAFSGIFMYKFSNLLSNDSNFSLRSGIILITSFYVIAITNEAPWDIFTHGFMLAGLYYLFQFFNTDKDVWKNTLISGVLIGLSIMCKGPVSLFAMFLPFVISYGIVYKFKGFKRKLVPFISFVILFLVIGGWWFVYVRIADPEAFIEITKKETSRWGSYNVRPFYYYWSFFVQSGIWAILALVSLMYPYLKKKVANKSIYKFSFLWTILAFVLLSAIPEKKSRYLVPVLFPLALNISIYFNYLIVNFKQLKSKERLPIYIHFGLFAILGLAVPIVLAIQFPVILKSYLFNYMLLSIILILTSISILKNLKQKNIHNLFYTMPLFLGSILLFGLPFSKVIQENEHFESIITLKTLEQENATITYALKTPTPELIWFYGEKIPSLYSLADLETITEDRFGLLIDTNAVDKLDTIKDQFEVEFVKNFNMNSGQKQRNRLIRSYYLISKKTTFEQN